MLIQSFQERLDGLCKRLQGGSIKMVKKDAQPFLTTSLDTTALGKELATQFINQVVNQSILLSSIRLHRTDKPTGYLTKLNISGHITQGATENTDSGYTRKPSSAGVTYLNVKSRSAMDITGEVQEDNIEGPSGKQTILNAMIDAVANDMEVMALEGDSSVAGSDDLSLLLKVNDGFNTQASAANGAHVVNAGALRFGYTLSSVMKRAMPTKWKRNMSKLRWIISYNTQQDYIDEQAARVTPYGDTIRQTSELPLINGIASMVVPLLPEDLSLTGTSGTTGTFILLTDPQNLIYVVQRDLKVEWWRNIRKDADEATMYMRTDFLIQEQDAVVKASNVSVYNKAAYYS